MQTVILLGTAHPHIFHRFQYLKDQEVRVLGYYESDKQISSRMQEKSGFTEYTNCDELLQLNFDTVLIHGRDYENANYIRLAINNGAKAIFLEKPGVARPEELHELRSEITRLGIIFEIGWELHYLETVEFARQLLRSAVLGNITQVRFHGGCPGGAAAEPWQSYEENIGGFFYSLGGHVVEILVDLFGLPNQVVSSIRKLPVEKAHRGFSWFPDLFGERELNPEKAIGTLVHEDLASAILEYDTMNAHLDFTAWEPSGYLHDWTVDIYGTGGALHLNLETGGYILMKDEGEGWKAGRNEILVAEKYGKGEMLTEAFIRQMDAFFSRIRTGKSSSMPCDEVIAQKVLQLFDALYKSAETRLWVPVEGT
ncbi:hypothetical protein N7520_000690 [Penicillium odoratum]|uniref:uncharacterized protein n=1 Tax=Penicillium odoratum TaxID=1167516 RepID=UPI002546E32B|nr:uncharacterized protein N7520_000690 [Penicillium odoratum]KAJ5777444.1 hypothetical protein N7520_000690 [Penicillium odoratum]